MNASGVYVRALGIGLVSGLRSMTGPAATRVRAGGTPALVVPLLALGELIVDKLPGVPPRTAPPALAVRALAGGFAGADLARDDGDERIGFVLGAAGAIAASYLALRLRRAAGAATGLPDPLIAVVEDIAAISAGLLLTA
jgi:uncharacterized membrane protein